ncbi:MAG: hypothetical protein AB1401_11500 [Thermodesulfobacteriota bacterium]
MFTVHAFGDRRELLMTSVVRKACIILSMIAIVLSLSVCVTPKKREAFHVKYTIAAQSVIVSSAVTRYDFDAKARHAFLYWFKRGFETVLAGKPQMMITWEETTEGEAGRKGYDLGMSEGEKYMQSPKATNQPVQTTPIPPG